MKKLDHYGINESAKRLIHSYLTDRLQFAEFNSYKSTYLPISTGVPQGSVNEEVINVELAKLSEWLGANKLALNISKTKYMVFHTSNRAVTYLNLKINNTYIDHVFEFNFLDVIYLIHT